jgi:hypothetical protein
MEFEVLYLKSLKCEMIGRSVRSRRYGNGTRPSAPSLVLFTTLSAVYGRTLDCIESNPKDFGLSVSRAIDRCAFD